MAEELVDWLDLPYHIVELIINKLIIPEISNYIKCGAVCTSWRTVFLDHPHPLPRRLQQPPLLIVPTPITENNTEMTTTTTNTKSISFYNIIHQKIYNQFQVTIPIDRHFRGSSHGWLVSVDEQNDCQVLLFNPFLTLPSSEILLPSLKHLLVDNNPCNATHGTPSTYAYLRKAVLSADPSSNSTDYIVMAIFGPLARLAYYRPGDEKWTTLAEFEYDKLFRDVIYCNNYNGGGMFMALNVYGVVVVLDPRKDMEVTGYIPPPPFELAPYIVYLVESSVEDLLQIHRITELGDEDEVTQRSPYATTNFRVFKLCANDGGEQEWRVLKSLGDRTLFLGNNETISICASEYPGLKPNSIYFTDDNMDYYYREPWNGPHDLGIFNLEDGSIENHHPTDHETPIWPIPIWIEPSVQKKIIFEGGNLLIKWNV